jgi:hypothetical protein
MRFDDEKCFKGVSDVILKGLKNSLKILRKSRNILKIKKNILKLFFTVKFFENCIQNISIKFTH